MPVAMGEGPMFYEDVRMTAADTVDSVALAYGHANSAMVWSAGRNQALRQLRGSPAGVVAGDLLMVPIPWKTTRRTLTIEVRGVGFEATRDGEKGKHLSWVQTVFQSNQVVPGTKPFCVDGCPADDSLPFYWTDAELAADPDLRVKFVDHPSRSAPIAAAGTTGWRAIVSLAVVTGKRVTVFDSWVWGFDLTPANVVVAVGPRQATPAEFNGHLGLLRKGVGTAAGTFTVQGWMFRAAP